MPALTPEPSQPSQLPPKLVSSSASLWSALWRAAAYCIHPKVIALSLVPLLLSIGVLGALAWFFWGDATRHIEAWLMQWSWAQVALSWLQQWGIGRAQTWLASALLIAVSVPVVVTACLLLVAGFMAPAVVKLVKARRFPALVSSYQAPWWRSLAWSLGATVLAAAAMLLSLPLWLIPPIGLILPPLIWGWLTYRVMAFDVLADHASPQERDLILREHRGPLLAMGVITGYLGAAPSVLWAMGALSVVLAPFMVVASLWLYILVFVFACLWFAHYLLDALQTLRAQAAPQAIPILPVALPPEYT